MLEQAATITKQPARGENDFFVLAAAIWIRDWGSGSSHSQTQLRHMGIDPTTHKPKTDALGGSDGCQSKDATNLSHMA